MLLVATWLAASICAQPAAIPPRFIGTASVSHQLLDRAFPNIQIEAAWVGDKLKLSSWGHGCSFEVRGQLPAVELLGSCRIERDGFELEATLGQGVVAPRADGALGLHLDGAVQVHRQTTYSAMGSSVSVRVPLGTAQVSFDGVAASAPQPAAAAAQRVAAAPVARPVPRLARPVLRAPMKLGCALLQ